MGSPAQGAEAPIHPYLRARLTEGFGGNISKFAYACETTPSMAAKWVAEDPRRRVTPSPASCRKIAHGLRVDLDYVLALAGHREAPSGETPQLDARLAAFLSAVESGWRALEGRKAELDIAERGTRALFHVDDMRKLPDSRRRRVTDDDGDLDRSNRTGNQTTLKHRPYQSVSVATLKAAHGFQPF